MAIYHDFRTHAAERSGLERERPRFRCAGGGWCVCVSVCLNCVIYPPPRATAAAATKPICVHCACVAAAAVARMLYGRYRRHNDVPSVLCVALWHAIC